MSMSYDVAIVERRPTADEYRNLRDGAGWHTVSELLAERALIDSIFCSVAESDGKAVGMALVVSKDGQNFFVHDVIVLPPFRRKGLATLLVASVISQFAQLKTEDADVVLSLVADPQLDAFYAKFGFQLDSERACMQLRQSRAAQVKADGNTTTCLEA